VLEEGLGGDKQVDVVRQLYHRQLQIPQPNAQQLLQEYEEWEKQHGHVSGRDRHAGAGSRGACMAQLVAICNSKCRQGYSSTQQGCFGLSTHTVHTLWCCSDLQWEAAGRVNSNGRQAYSWWRMDTV